MIITRDIRQHISAFVTRVIQQCISNWIAGFLETCRAYISVISNLNIIPEPKIKLHQVHAKPNQVPLLWKSTIQSNKKCTTKYCMYCVAHKEHELAPYHFYTTVMYRMGTMHSTKIMSLWPLCERDALLEHNLNRQSSLTPINLHVQSKWPLMRWVYKLILTKFTPAMILNAYYWTLT